MSTFILCFQILNEKNILQRQSLVFMSDAMDNRLLDALNQIGDLQTAMEEQRNRFEHHLGELQVKIKLCIVFGQIIV